MIQPSISNQNVRKRAIPGSSVVPFRVSEIKEHRRPRCLENKRSVSQSDTLPKRTTRQGKLIPCLLYYFVTT